MKPLLCLTLVTLLFTSQAAFADEPAATQPTTRTIEEKIARTGVSAGIDAGYGIRLWDHGTSIDMPVGAVHVAFPLTRPVGSSWYRGVLDYRLEIQGGVVTNMDDNAFVGLSPIGLRYNFTAAGKLVPYLEGLLGGAYIDVPNHIQGSKFNFTQMAGVGTQYFMTPDIALNMQARFMHLSNAGLKEPNHGINEGFLLVGISFY